MIRTKSGRVLPPPSEKSREIAVQFLNWLKVRGVSENTQHRYLITLRKIISWCEMWGKTIYDTTYEDWLKISNELHESNMIPIIKAILKFLYETTNDEKFMEIYQKVKVPKKKKRLPEVLTPEEVQNLIKACSRIDFELKVLVEIVYETGARVGEILSLKRKDVEFDEYGCRIYIRKSKSEFRCNRVVLYASDLLKLCEGKDPEDYIFSHEYNWYLRKLSEAWELTGLPQTKRKFHILRHSRATEMLRKKVLSEKEMMLWFGWKTRDMIDVYSHITMEDVEKSYLSAVLPNLNNNSSKELGTGEVCPRCGFPVNNGFKYCPRCGQPLTGESSLEKLKEAKIQDEKFEEAKEIIQKLVKIALESPDLLRRLLDHKP